MADDSKTEKATPKKRRDQRKEGHVASSKDVIVVASLLGLFFSLQLLLPMIYGVLRESMLHFVHAIAEMEALTQGNLREVALRFTLAVAEVVLPLGFISMGIAVVATGVQTRFLFAKKAASFKLSNLSIIRGIKNLFSVKNLVELIKGLLKIIILAAVVYGLLKDDIVKVAQMMDMDMMAASVHVLQMVMQMAMKVSLVFAAIAGFDFFYQKWSFEKQIRMSKEEVKEEHKQMEGNPQTKSRIRGIQRERAKARMMQAVPTADVIIRNPTHYAVALKYDIDHDNAPILVAKGQDLIALKIVEIGEANQVAIIENKPLARGIYASTPLDREIPAEYYGVVAEILVQVFRMNKKKLE